MTTDNQLATILALFPGSFLHGDETCNPTAGDNNGIYTLGECRTLWDKHERGGNVKAAQRVTETWRLLHLEYQQLSLSITEAW